MKSSGSLDNLMNFPQKIMIEVSSYCNHSCLFCSNRLSKRKKQFINEDIARKVICEASQLSVKEIGFHGMGEPLTNPNICEYIKLAKSLKISYTYIDTNGALANPTMIDNLLVAGLDSIKFSISAFDKDTFRKIQGKDDFEKVIENLNYLIEMKKRFPHIKIFIDYVLCDLNKGQEKELIKEYKEKVNDIWISPIVNQGGNMFDKLSDLVSSGITKNTAVCTEPFNRFIVTSEGFATACCMDNDNNLKYADLNNSSLSLIDVWKCGEEIRSAHRTGENLPPICSLCDMKKCFEAK